MTAEKLPPRVTPIRFGTLVDGTGAPPDAAVIVIILPGLIEAHIP